MDLLGFTVRLPAYRFMCLVYMQYVLILTQSIGSEPKFLKWSSTVKMMSQNSAEMKLEF